MSAGIVNRVLFLNVQYFVLHIYYSYMDCTFDSKHVQLPVMYIVLYFVLLWMHIQYCPPDPCPSLPPVSTAARQDVSGRGNRAETEHPLTPSVGLSQPLHFHLHLQHHFKPRPPPQPSPDNTLGQHHICER